MLKRNAMEKKTVHKTQVFNVIILDSVELAMKLSIRNSRNFAYSDEGTRASMEKDTCTRMNFFSRLASFRKSPKGYVDSMSAEERHNLYTSMADEAFDEEEGK